MALTAVAAQHVHVFPIQTQKLAENFLQWTKEGGFVFFRESCFTPSGEYMRADCMLCLL